jgi:hypothetical protein
VPAIDLSATADLPPAAEPVGTVIGPYKLREQIGIRNLEADNPTTGPGWLLACVAVSLEEGHPIPLVAVA